MQTIAQLTTKFEADVRRAAIQMAIDALAAGFDAAPRPGRNVESSTRDEAVRAAIAKAGGGATTAALASALGISKGNAWNWLNEACRRGVLVKRLRRRPRVKGQQAIWSAA